MGGGGEREGRGVEVLGEGGRVRLSCRVKRQRLKQNNLTLTLCRRTPPQ